MKRVEYTLESSKVDSDKNIAICADLHINQKTPTKKITEVLDTLDDIKPTHIVIPGDLYNTERGAFYDNEQISNFINAATDIADVFYVKGNIEQNYSLLPYILYNNHNPKFHLLCERNWDGKYRFINQDGINIAGIKLPLDYYRLSESDRVDYILDYYRKYLEKLSKCCGTQDFNVLLCHDPMIVKFLLYLDTLAARDLHEHGHNFDLVISGHNHGGIWPEWMKPIFELGKANMEMLYPTYTKGMVSAGYYGEKMIVSEGITKFHPDFGKLQILEKFHEGTIENVQVLSRKK